MTDEKLKLITQLNRTVEKSKAELYQTLWELRLFYYGNLKKTRQEAISQKINLAQSTISQIERNKKDVNVSTLLRLAMGYDCILKIVPLDPTSEKKEIREYRENIHELIVNEFLDNYETTKEKAMMISNWLIDQTKFIRRSLNIKQKEFAENIGIFQPMISSFENGKNNRRLSTLLKILLYMGYDLEVVTIKTENDQRLETNV